MKIILFLFAFAIVAEDEFIVTENGMTYVKDDIMPPTRVERAPSIVHDDLEICDYSKLEFKLKEGSQAVINGNCFIIQSCLQKKLASDERVELMRLKKDYCSMNTKPVSVTTPKGETDSMPRKLMPKQLKERKNKQAKDESL